ncbi:MAG: apolipoprotein N-acyltransferase, partial [Myxococcales bacterium]|nr:apolipoprotein N-acyltransferase [Myxococcales bacterium]
ATLARSPSRGFVLGWLAGVVAMLGGYYWVVHLLQEFANFGLPMAVLGYLLLSLYQGLVLGVVVAVAVAIHRRWQVPNAVALALALTAGEAFFPFLFPNYAGNALYRVPLLTQHVELFGMAGVSLLLGVVNGALVDLILVQRGRGAAHVPLAIALASLGAVAIYGAIRIAQVDADLEGAETMRVALVQANVGARASSDEKDEMVLVHREMTRDVAREHPDLDLVVWPESSYNRFIPRDKTDLASVNGYITVPLLFGAVTGNIGSGEREIYNSAVLTSSTGALASRFDKVELLMFGETIPFVESVPQIREWFPRSSTFTRGKTFEHLVFDDVELLPMICYEDIIPSFVQKIWSKAGPADVLVNITNDSWYGDSHEPLIHLALATFRSIETRRALIRSTNTGISALIDPVGRIVKRTGQWTRETLVGDVPLIKDGSSTLFMKTGDVAGAFSALVCLVGILVPRRRPSSFSS